MTRAQSIGMLAAVLLVAAPAMAGSGGKIDNPDFTKGDAIPEGATHDWNLGATGARGWMYSDTLTTSEARQVYITTVAAGSPAEGVLAVGDVLLGVDGKRFAYDPRTEIGKALTLAEATDGNLRLIRWRAGATEDVAVNLPVLGRYSPTAPYDCAKSRRILEQGWRTLAMRIDGDGYNPNAIPRSLNALALLASGDERYLPQVRKEAQWAAGFTADGFQTWYDGYVVTFLAEYVMATGDASVMPGLRRLAMEAATGQSKVGSWGHGFAGPDGRLLGYGMMNAPGVPLTIALVLARQAGVKDARVDLAIERSLKLLRFYAGKGCIPYGDHRPWIQTHDDNGKNGMAAVLFNLVGEPGIAEYFSRMSVASHGADRDLGHTGNFLNILWSIPGIAQSGPHATGQWMNEFGGWYFDLARQPDGGFVHLGPPQNTNDTYSNWDCTGAYLLAYAWPLKSLQLTRDRPNGIPQLSASQAQQLIEDGRDWTNKDRHSFYDKLSTDELIARLGNWSPVVRERAAIALGRRDDDVIGRLIGLLDSDDLYTRYGACQAIKMQRQRGEPAVAALLKTFEADDLWLRILAAEALAGIGEPARPAVPAMLERLTRHDVRNDPRNMEQRYLSFALFDRRGGLIGQSLDGIDRGPLMKAVRAGLRNEDGRARGSYATVYENLSFEELQPLMPAIYEAIATPAPSGIMFADQIRMAGLRLFARHRVDRGIELLAMYARHMKPHASEKRIIPVMEMLTQYGAHAQRVIPQLEATAHYFENDEPDFPKRLSLGKAKVVRETIAKIKASTDKPELVRLDLD